jgi:hypothetical protein
MERVANGEFEGPETMLSTGDVVRSWPSPAYRLYYQRTSDGETVFVRVYDQRRRAL